MRTAKYDINYLAELRLEALSLDSELGPATTEPILTILPKEFVNPKKPILPFRHHACIAGAVQHPAHGGTPNEL